jgi:hypothetical protein
MEYQKGEKGMIHCNRCRKGSCSLFPVPRAKRRTDAEMHEICKQDCGVAVFDKVWKNPLIMLAIDRNVDGVADVLTAFGIEFDEIDHKPYFRLVTRG